jgi:hypothetical protein
MKLKIVHFVFLAFILSFFTGTLSSCFRRGEETPVADLEFFIGDNKFMAKAMNEAVKGDNITVYTRDYKDADGKYLLTIGGAHNDRDVISIKYNRDEESTSYTVITADTSGGSKADTRIPVNGFVVSIPKKSTEGLRFRSNQEVKVSGFEAIAPEYERFDFGTFIPEDKTLTRRVTYINPVAEVYEQSCITLITNDYGRAVELPEGAVAFVMRLVASDNYRITTVMTGGTVDEGSNALIFTGEYNALYAKTFFSEGDKLYISRKDRISSYSDVSAVQINGELYKIGDEKTNLASISESGIYLFNSFFSSLVTPERELDFYDLVVVDDIVVYKGEKNTRIILPSNAGVVVSFVGESVHIAEGLELGDTVTAILMKTRSLPDKYLSVGGFVFEILSVNGIRSEENSCVIYTPEFGTHTGTDSNGTEIVVSAGRIKTVRIAEGNSEIPEDGYVISILRTNSAYKYADNIEAGTDCTVSLADRAYSVLKMNYNNINSVRSTDMLILYKSIPKTGTNTHGYEIIVDSNGKITKENYSGDSLIPDGGLVLSAHGEAEKKLKPAFTIGADVLINEKNKEVTIISTPILKVENAMLAYEQINRQYEQAKAAFYDVNYNSLRNTLDEVVSILNRSEQAMNESDYPTAIGLSATAAEMLDRLSFSMIRSSSIENRAAWYRPTERSEREVKATIEKALSLNINTIYLETWYNGKVIGYSDNSLITHNTSANGDLDALEAFCRIGKENGIEIHAWVENFFIGTLQSAAQNPDDLINKTLGKHLLDKQGNNFNSTIYGDFVFLNPYDRSNRALVMEVYREII